MQHSVIQDRAHHQGHGGSHQQIGTDLIQKIYLVALLLVASAKCQQIRAKVKQSNTHRIVEDVEHHHPRHLRPLGHLRNKEHKETGNRCNQGTYQHQGADTPCRGHGMLYHISRRQAHQDPDNPNRPRHTQVCSHAEQLIHIEDLRIVQLRQLPHHCDECGCAKWADQVPKQSFSHCHVVCFNSAHHTWLSKQAVFEKLSLHCILSPHERLPGRRINIRLPQPSKK